MDRFIYIRNAEDDAYMNTSANFRGMEQASSGVVVLYFESPITSAVGPNAYDKITLAVTANKEKEAMVDIAGALAGGKSGTTAVIADDYGAASCSDFISTSAGVTTIAKALSGTTKNIKKVLADTTLTSGDSGAIVLVNPTATTAITLPTMASSLAGWNCKVMITEDVAGTVGGMGQIVNIDFGSGNVIIGQIGSSSDVAGDFAVANDDFINFTAAASPGDFVDIFTDGTNWYVSGMSTDAAGSDVKFHTAAAA